MYILRLSRALKGLVKSIVLCCVCIFFKKNTPGTSRPRRGWEITMHRGQIFLLMQNGTQINDSYSQCLASVPGVAKTQPIHKRCAFVRQPLRGSTEPEGSLLYKLCRVMFLPIFHSVKKEIKKWNELTSVTNASCLVFWAFFFYDQICCWFFKI